MFVRNLKSLQNCNYADKASPTVQKFLLSASKPELSTSYRTIPWFFPQKRHFLSRFCHKLPQNPLRRSAPFGKQSTSYRKKSQKTMISYHISRTQKSAENDAFLLTLSCFSTFKHRNQIRLWFYGMNYPPTVLHSLLKPASLPESALPSIRPFHSAQRERSD